jgi:hypothetical protein
LFAQLPADVMLRHFLSLHTPDAGTTMRRVDCHRIRVLQKQHNASRQTYVEPPANKRTANLSWIKHCLLPHLPKWNAV